MAAVAAAQSLGGTQYQQKAQELNELINSLRTTGAQFVLDLPTVCVCGNQSAGKSSVMEGLSGVKLPRSGGTCTRCPMEVRLASQGSFSCSLKLRYEYDDSTGEKREGGVKEVLFDEPVTDEEEVEAAIRRAQKAILNPSKPKSTFEKKNDPNGSLSCEPGDEANSNELQFTKNVVVVEITGGPADLTLIDLPGIIRNTEHPEDAKYITIIQDLVKSYINKDNTIIVATVTCSDDIDNQEVVKLAKEADPEMKRTLGVLTKPDRIDDGQEKQWLDVLQGGRYVLNLGWFVVKNPTQTQLDEDISFEQARELEAEFFRHSPVWNSAGQTGRLGTGYLRHSLSDQLVELIKLKLPSMLQTVLDNLGKVEAELKVLPAAVKDPMVEFALLVNRLHEELQSTLTAGPSCQAQNKVVYRNIKRKFAEFQSTIIRTQPVFKFKRSRAWPSTEHDVVLVAAEADGNGVVSAASLKELQAARATESTAEAADMVSSCIEKPALSLADVNSVIMEEAGAELPGTIPYGAMLAFVQRFQENWAELADECCGEVAQELLACTERKVEASLKRFPGMLRMVKGLLSDMYTSLSDSVQKQVQELANDELQPAFTLNEHYLQDSKTKLLNRLLKVWREQQHSPLEDVKQQKLQEAAASLQQVPGFENRHCDDLFRTLDLGRDQQALELMATAMAYLKVAAKRFGDVVPMRISRALLREFPGVLQRAMLRLLAEHTAELEELMQEDVHLVARRSVLLGNQKCLKEARSKLSRFA